MIAEKLFLKTLENLRYGRLELIAPSGRLIFGDAASDITSTLVVENPRFFSRAVFGGDDSTGDSYVDGDWWSTDLISLVRIAVRNLATLSKRFPLVGCTERGKSCRLPHPPPAAPEHDLREPPQHRRALRSFQ